MSEEQQVTLPDDFDWRTQTTKRGTVFRVGQVVRDVCELCGAVDVLVYDTPDGEHLVCNTCVRKFPADQRQACDKCGTKGNVWRDPIPRKNEYLCVGCQTPGHVPVNRWAKKARELPVRESAPLGIRERPKCAYGEYNPGSCRGEIRWDSQLKAQACNFHRGRKSANPNNN